MTSRKKDKRTLLPRALLIAGLTLLLIAESFFGFKLHTLSSQQEQLKIDYASANNITLGLFSAEQWKDEVAGIVNHQVQHF